MGRIQGKMVAKTVGAQSPRLLVLKSSQTVGVERRPVRLGPDRGGTGYDRQPPRQRLRRRACTSSRPCPFLFSLLSSPYLPVSRFLPAVDCFSRLPSALFPPVPRAWKPGGRETLAGTALGLRRGGWGLPSSRGGSAREAGGRGEEGGRGSGLQLVFRAPGSDRRPGTA